jgi:hypothetical protein
LRLNIRHPDSEALHIFLYKASAKSMARVHTVRRVLLSERHDPNKVKSCLLNEIENTPSILVPPQPNYTCSSPAFAIVLHHRYRNFSTVNHYAIPSAAVVIERCADDDYNYEYEYEYDQRVPIGFLKALLTKRLAHINLNIRYARPSLLSKSISSTADMYKGIGSDMNDDYAGKSARCTSSTAAPVE